MKSYIISLHSKNIELCDEIKSYGIDPVWVKGIDSSNLSKKIIEENFTKNFSKWGTKHAFGCALSHIKVWKKILENNDEYALILEDDVVFENNFKKEFKDIINNVPDNFDILYLGCFGCGVNYKISNLGLRIYGKGELKKINDKIIIPRHALATHGYIISKKGCKKILDLLLGKIFNSIDICLNDILINKNANIYASTPLLINQTSTVKYNPSKHPIMINKLLDFQIEKNLTANYCLNTVMYENIMEINYMRIFILLFSGIMRLIIGNNKDYIYTISYIYFIINYIDMFFIKNWSGIIINYILLILPFMF